MLLTGIDIIEIYRIKDVCKKYPNRFLNKIFTKQEISYCKGRYPQIAARFATKEAVMKLLGTGIRGVPWKSIEVYRARGQAPQVILHGNAKIKAEQLGINEIALSISHSRNYAVASVVSV
jgi:holo-[acyl-carrier protein] synthase|tara:strand:+ start:980 stop:1339 length:360 start_codon:yes stop_codon:yes gene_type:complete